MKDILSGFVLGIFLTLACAGVVFSISKTETPSNVLPTHIILNDWTNGKSISYVAYPEIEDDILVLNEATVTFVEDLKE